MDLTVNNAKMDTTISKFYFKNQGIKIIFSSLRTDLFSNYTWNSVPTSLGMQPLQNTDAYQLTIMNLASYI